MLSQDSSPRCGSSLVKQALGVSMIFKYCFLLIIFVVLPCEGASDFVTEICSNQEFVKCVGTNTEKCKNLFLASQNTCTKKYPIDYGLEKEKFTEKAKQNSECTTREFIKSVGADDVKFEKCGKFLQPMFDEYRRKARKELERLEKENNLSD